MHANAYQSYALRTAIPHQTPDERLDNAIIGIGGEGGELLELLKKWKYQGHGLDREALKKELGDVLWYVALACDALDTSIGAVMYENIEKLRHRYPAGFSAEQSVNRVE